MSLLVNEETNLYERHGDYITWVCLYVAISTFKQQTTVDLLWKAPFLFLCSSCVRPAATNSGSHMLSCTPFQNIRKYVRRDLTCQHLFSKQEPGISFLGVVPFHINFLHNEVLLSIIWMDLLYTKFYCSLIIDCCNKWLYHLMKEVQFDM